MRAFLPLFLLAAVVVTGCSTIGSRKSERAAAYNALSARYRALVDEGFIDVGMDTDAVYIAWGKPYEIMRVDFPSGERTVWVYTAATAEQVSSSRNQPISSPVSSGLGIYNRPGTRPFNPGTGIYNRPTTTVLRRRTNGWVSFEDGKVASFDSYAPTQAR